MTSNDNNIYFGKNVDMTKSEFETFLEGCEDNNIELIEYQDKFCDILDRLNLQVGRFVEVFNEENTKRKLGKIFICIYVSERNSTNAWCIKQGENYFIALSSYIINGLNMLIEGFVQENIKLTLMKAKDLFEDNFKQDFVQEYYHVDENNVDEIFEDFIFDKNMLQGFSPSKIVNFLCNNILNMVLDHELGHVLSGHFEKENILFMEMGERDESNDKDKLESQVKEYMADYVGIRQHSNFWMKQNQESVIHQVVCYFLDLVAMNIMLSSFINDNMSNSRIPLDELVDFKEGTHPPYSVRENYFHEQIKQEYLKFAKDHEEQAGKIDLEHGQIGLKELFNKVDFISRLAETLYEIYIGSIVDGCPSSDLEKIIITLANEASGSKVKRYIVKLQERYLSEKVRYNSFVEPTLPLTHYYIKNSNYKERKRKEEEILRPYNKRPNTPKEQRRIKLRINKARKKL